MTTQDHINAIALFGDTSSTLIKRAQDLISNLCETKTPEEILIICKTIVYECEDHAVKQIIYAEKNNKKMPEQLISYDDLGSDRNDVYWILRAIRALANTANNMYQLDYGVSAFM